MKNGKVDRELGQTEATKAGRTALLGVSVNVLVYVATRIVNLGVTIVLARSLDPSGIGLLAAILLIFELADVVRGFGFRMALIYQKENSDRIYHDAFGALIMIGLTQGLFIIVLAQFSDQFVSSPGSGPLLICLVPIFFAQALGTVQEAQLLRAFRFPSIALADFVAVVAKASIALLLLALGQGVLSLILALVLAQFARTAVLWMLCDWRPMLLRPLRNNLAFLFGYGSNIVFGSALFFLRRRADQFAILVTMSDAALGLYFVASRIPDLLLQGISAAISDVIFTMLSKISDDAARLEERYLETVRATVCFMVPLSLGLCVVAAGLISVVFGDKWTAAAPVLALLGLTGFFMSLGWNVGDLMKASGRPDLLWKVMVLEFGTLIPLVWIAAVQFRTIEAIATAMLLGEVISTLIRLSVSQKLFGIRILSVLRVAAPSILAGLLMSVTILTSRVLPVWPANEMISLVAGVLLGLLIYPAAYWMIDRRTVMLWIKIIKGRASN